MNLFFLSSWAPNHACMCSFFLFSSPSLSRRARGWDHLQLVMVIRPYGIQRSTNSVSRPSSHSPVLVLVLVPHGDPSSQAPRNKKNSPPSLNRVFLFLCLRKRMKENEASVKPWSWSCVDSLSKRLKTSLLESKAKSCSQCLKKRSIFKSKSNWNLSWQRERGGLDERWGCYSRNIRSFETSWFC